MPKFIRVTMPDQPQWDINIVFIAEARATYYKSQAKRDYESCKWAEDYFTWLYNKEYVITMKDNVKAIDWLKNHMNWEEDVWVIANKVPKKELTLQGFNEGLTNGKKEVVEHG